MARFTQYIGLSPASVEFLNTHEHKKIAQYRMTIGIAYEDVMGDVYEVNMGNDDFGIPRWDLYVEYEDACPWSSGPMIHTALMHVPSGNKGFAWKESEIHQI